MAGAIKLGGCAGGWIGVDAALKVIIKAGSSSARPRDFALHISQRIHATSGLHEPIRSPPRPGAHKPYGLDARRFLTHSRADCTACQHAVPEIMLVGRSNAGKIHFPHQRARYSKTIYFASKKPGRSINLFALPDGKWKPTQCWPTCRLLAVKAVPTLTKTRWQQVIVAAWSHAAV